MLHISVNMLETSRGYEFPHSHTDTPRKTKKKGRDNEQILVIPYSMTCCQQVPPHPPVERASRGVSVRGGLHDPATWHAAGHVPWSPSQQQEAAFKVHALMPTFMSVTRVSSPCEKPGEWAEEQGRPLLAPCAHFLQGKSSSEKGRGNLEESHSLISCVPHPSRLHCCPRIT